jgi:UDP-N-acetylmuramoylalanine--D-glutamate ligase
MRILGKGKTALAIKQIYQDAKIYDDSNTDKYDINSDELTVVSPGISHLNTIVQNTKNPISDYDLFLTNDDLSLNNEIFSIWISGTNGKTTTTQMCEYLLKDKDFIACGNIGLPLAIAIKNNYTKLIIESSSYTLHYTSYAKANIYLLLPISDDHLSWHGSFEHYESCKLKPLDKLINKDYAIIPDKYKDYKTNAKLITYKNSNDLAIKLDIQIKKINFKEPFLLDAILAMSVYKILFNDINYKNINSFKTDAHKMEEFYNKNNILYVNDSKGTNVDATIQALRTYKNNLIHIILGGDDKGANLEPLFKELKKYNVLIYSIGANSNKINKFSNKNKLVCCECYNLLNAIKIIKKNLNARKSKQVVLLSPATSSFDQFKSYKQRGDVFKYNMLLKLPNKKTKN